MRSPMVISNNSGGDVTVARLESKSGRVHIFISLYLPYERPDPPGHEVEELLEDLADKGHLIIGCDANAHHFQWGSNDTNVRGWIDTMLSSRIINSSIGEIYIRKSVTRGTPQGGVLSPLLWLLVINNIIMDLEVTGTKVVAYADDVVLLIAGKFVQTISDLMQGALVTLSRWARRNGLGVNPSKTELVIFTKRRKYPTFTPPKLDGVRLNLSLEAKYLGTILDHRLSWKRNTEERAKRGSVKPPLCHFLQVIHKHYSEKNQQKWLDEIGCTIPKRIWPTLSEKRTRSLMSLSKPDLILVVGIITGHCKVRAMTSKWDSDGIDYCRICQDEEEIETIEHLLCHCPALINVRHRLVGELVSHDLSSFSNTDPVVILQLARRLKWLKTTRQTPQP
ncbi:uncharacterized protein LOC131804232 isoform X1 [Musca domestica]|uniref:Uncharacterized protein LOC131804232 isoform X1 n=1 Tax=Musca domestica TaxID=7370 RepID=A0ABM3VAH1_MUSDO|nr:uncharacterized protein LOC131804232 isoform X1 [Musca domestica]